MRRCDRRSRGSPRHIRPRASATGVRRLGPEHGERGAMRLQLATRTRDHPVACRLEVEAGNPDPMPEAGQRSAWIARRRGTSAAPFASAAIVRRSRPRVHPRRHNRGAGSAGRARSRTARHARKAQSPRARGTGTRRTRRPIPALTGRAGSARELHAIAPETTRRSAGTDAAAIAPARGPRVPVRRAPLRGIADGQRFERGRERLDEPGQQAAAASSPAGRPRPPAPRSHQTRSSGTWYFGSE